MIIKIITFAVVFAAFFLIVNALYPYLESFFRRWQQKRMEKISPRLDEMLIDVSLKRLMLIDIFSPIGSGIAGYIITRNLWITLGCAVAGLIIPFIVVRRMKASRRQKFSAQLVDGLMIISSSLKAGLSLLQSFEALVEEMPPPIAQEFNFVVRQMQMGISMEEAMISLKRRMRVDELDMVVTAMMVARETGGDLTETFSRVVYTINERNKLIGRVNALCVQAKLQGIIMSILPLVFGIFVYKMNPGFFDVFFRDDYGKALLTYAVISEVLGIIFIRRFSKVDI